MKITNDETYNKSLAWLVERAQMIENPLLDEKTKAEHMRKYELVEKEVLRYRHPYMFEQEKDALAEWL